MPALGPARQVIPARLDALMRSIEGPGGVADTLTQRVAAMIVPTAGAVGSGQRASNQSLRSSSIGASRDLVVPNRSASRLLPAPEGRTTTAGLPQHTEHGEGIGR